MAQMGGAGVLVKRLTGMPYQSAVVVVGAAMIIYVAFGGMLATTWVQIVKAVLMLAAAAVILMMVLATIRFDPLALFEQAETRYGPQYLLPGNYLKNPFHQISLWLGYVCGLPGLPHVITPLYPVPAAKS